MNVASSSTRAADGAAEEDWAAASTFPISVTEKCDAPLLMVAAIFPSGDNANPKGLGASRLTSRPAGDTNRPFGRMAPGLPSTVVKRAAGRSPAGA
jgi:hypothetical protein